MGFTYIEQQWHKYEQNSKKNNQNKKIKIINTFGKRIIDSLIQNLYYSNTCTHLYPQSIDLNLQVKNNHLQVNIHTPKENYIYRNTKTTNRLLCITKFLCLKEIKSTIFNTYWTNKIKKLDRKYYNFFYQIPETESYGRYGYMLTGDIENIYTNWIVILDLEDDYAKNNNLLHFVLIPVDLFEYNFLTMVHNQKTENLKIHLLHLYNAIDIVYDHVNNILPIKEINIISNNFYCDLIYSLHLHIYIKHDDHLTLMQKNNILQKNYGLI